MPTANEEVVSVALPALKVVVPRVAAPSRNVTEPVGVPAPGETALTVAVNVTDWPDTDGFTELVSVVELDALLTVCVTAKDALELKLLSPA